MSIHEGLDQVDDDVSKYIMSNPEQVADNENKGDDDVPIGRSRRSRTMTEKGKEYQQRVLFEKRKKLHARLMMKFKLIDDLMYSSSNLETVKEETQQLNDQFNMLIETHGEYLKLLSPEAVENEEDWFDTIDEEVFTQKHKIHNWMRSCEEDDKRSEKSGRSRKSSSKGSHKSSDKGSKKSLKSSSSGKSSAKSSVEQMAIEDKLKMAELMAEASFMEEKHAALLIAEKLKQEEELAKLKARSKIFEEIQTMEQLVKNKDDTHLPVQQQHLRKIDNIKHNNDDNKINTDVYNIHTEVKHIRKEQKDNSKKRKEELNPEAPSYEPINTKKDDLYGTLTRMIQQQAAPEVEIDVFDGNPLEYNYFMDVFNEVVEKWIEDPKGRLLRLLKYTKGEAHDLIKHCVQEPAYMGYSHAKGLLRKRCGDPHIILSSYRKEVRNWPKLKFGDAKGFREFYNFIVKCDGVAKEQNWNAINTPDVICMLVSKLPNSLIDRWNRNAYHLRKKQDCEPSLSDLITFVDEETVLVNDPMFSRDALEVYNSEEEDKKNRKDKRRINAFATEADSDKCVYCAASHDIDACDDFKKLPIKERSKFYFKNKLCFACCNPISNNHSARNCTRRRKCKECQGGHPTSLHEFQVKQDDDKEPEEDVKSKTEVNCATAKFGETISMCVVPVRVRHKNSNTVVRTMAMLDNCSQGSFVKNDLLEKFAVEGTHTSITINTLNGKQKHTSVAVDGLEVSNIDESIGEWIKLPKMFSQDDLPVNANEIATPENIKQWKYLHKIIPEMKVDQQLEVGLLIGANCLRALEPQELISSQDNGPYAFRTRLGWCIVGPIKEGSQGKKFHCNRIAVQDVSTNSISKHSFWIESNIKESGISDLLKKLYYYYYCYYYYCYYYFYS